MQSNPMVSVALMSYNQQDYVRQAMDCVLAQQCNFSFEIVCGDDGSKDNTRDILLEYQQKHPGLIRVLPKEPNKGVLGNFRDTVKACRGKYVAICHSDDYWHDPLKLEKQVSFLESNPGYGVVHSGADCLLTSNGAIIKNYDENHNPDFRPESYNGDVFEAIIAGKYSIGTLTVCFNRELFNEYVDINEYIKAGFIYEDLPSWLELSRRTKFKYLPDSTATYRVMQESISRSKDLTKLFGFLKNHYVIKKYFIKKYGVSKEVEEAFEIMYHRKKFNMAYKWCSHSEAGDSFAFLKEKKQVSTKLWLQKKFLEYPFMRSALKSIKELYTPRTSPSRI